DEPRRLGRAVRPEDREPFPAAAVSGAGTLPARLLAAAGAAALCGGALSLLPPGAQPPPGGALAAAAAAAAAVLALPRAGWLLMLAGVGAWAAHGGLPGITILLAAAALPTVLLLPRDGVLWSAPALAPVLGLAGLALAWPAAAGQARHGLQRAALGGLGLWWLALAEPIAGPRLLLGDVPGTPAPHVWEGSAVHTVSDVLAPLVAHGVVLLALAWAACAWVLPLVVRGRSALVDGVLATSWAAALAAASASVASSLPWAGAPPSVRGLVLGAAAAACTALMATALRGR
ncbi:MAG TPA: hypothetical protein VMT10_04225, partial [Solirubrobacteraceae bacterium]|nr:hypothetical protein [Solirubrobacteraceae bacterium]